MEWTVVTVLVTIIGLFAAVGGPIAKLIQSITKLTLMLSNVTERLDTAVELNKTSHSKLWGHNKCQDEKLEKHEFRIFSTEQKVDAVEQKVDTILQSQYNEVK